MKIGFSTLSLFMKPYSEMVDLAYKNEFDFFELLCDGPHNGEYLLKNPDLIKPLKECDLEICMHGPTVDLNIASLNSRIREVSKQLFIETVDLASAIEATTITIHPGQIGRNDPRLREYALDLACESISELVDYACDNGVIISVENMPERFSFLCNRVEELERISKETKSQVTIDIGHSNTSDNTDEFLKMDKISYCHLNDNNQDKDAHLPLGEGNTDLNVLKRIDRGIIELNNFDNILKSKKVIEEILD